MSYLDNNSDFLRELARRGIHGPARVRSSEPDLDDPSPHEMREALPDYVKLSASGRPFNRAHPLARRMWSERSDVYALARRSGLTTSDFGNALADAYSTLLIAGFSSSTSDIEALTFPIDAANYRPQKISQVQLGTVPEFSAEDQEPGKIGFALVEARDGVLREFSGRISFSRQVFATYGETLSRALQTHARQVFPALERQALALALESATVPTVTAALTVAGLDTAVQTLRAQTVAGMAANLAPSAIVVHPGKEMTARVLIGAVYPNRDAPRVIVNPYLVTPSTYFLVTDPLTCPALLRLRMRNNFGPSIFSSVGDSGQIQFALSYSFDVVHTGGPGVVRCTA